MMLHAYKSSRVSMSEMRMDPITPTVFEKKKNMIVIQKFAKSYASTKIEMPKVVVSQPSCRQGETGTSLGVSFTKHALDVPFLVKLA